MKNVSAGSKGLLLAAMIIALAGVPSLSAEKKSGKQEAAKAERPAVAAKISDGKRTKFGFVSHTIDCPTYFARYGNKLTETIEVLLPDKMVAGKRYPVIYALAPLTSRGVVSHYKLDERHHLGPLMDIREQGLHNKHKVICIKVMAIHRHMNWKYLQDVVAPYVDRTYPTIAEARGRMLLGFSKTGDDVWKLLLANPDIFGKACAWDSLPKWDWIKPHAALLRGKGPQLILTGATKGAMEPVAALHRKLTEEKIPHLYHLKLRDVHNWSSGWIADAMRLLFKDFNRDTTSVSNSSAAAKSWKADTVLISPQGNQTVVQALAGKKVLFRNADPQLAVEWGMANARTTVVMAGKYVVSDGINIPRDDITLIIDQGAEISLNPKTDHKVDIGFRCSKPGYWKLVPLIYNHGHDNVRVISLGTLVRSVWDDGKSGKGTVPIVFDGRNDKLTCGVEGGLLVVTGPSAHACLLLDVRGVHIPLVTQAGLDAALILEGCESCSLGMIVNLASEPGGNTGKTVDLNSSNRSISIERLVGERSQEIIDCNASAVAVGEIVSIGKPRKLLYFCVGSKPRWTSRPRAAGWLDVWQAAILADAVDVRLRIEAPKLPDALPRFTVKATVEVTLKNGSKKLYAKEVKIDVRDGGAKPKKKQ